ncbi:MAG: putative transrane protein of unknown function [Rhodospirillales bacterium]|nr:putative transrane protein of unknown function [Rhodospirillales bacterium]
MTVSVVVATYNAAEYIENCILSVLGQTFSDFELLIIDGGSTDGTLDILNRYAARIRFSSERDRGIGDAHWKGVQAARGEWVYFLGGDDLLASPKAFQMLFQACGDRIAEADILTGQALYDDGRLYKSDRPDRLLIKNTIHHQGALYRRALFHERAFDTKLRVYYDYDFNLWAFYSGKKFVHTRVLIGLLSSGGLSDRPEFKNYVEDMRVRARHVSGFPLLFMTVLCVLRYLYKVQRIAVMSRFRSNR